MKFYNENKDSFDLIIMLVVIFSIVTWSKSTHAERDKLQPINKWETSGKTLTEVLETKNKPKLDSMALSLLKSLEGFNSKWQKCPKGVKTIGYGFTKIKWHGAMNKIEGDSILVHKYTELQKEIRNSLKGTTLSYNKLAALTLFTYNVGLTAFMDSTIFIHLSKGDIDKIDEELPRWVFIKTPKGVKYLRGLNYRRHKELELWNMELY